MDESGNSTSEVDNIELEKPLSPVLNNSKTNRKLLMGRKLSRKISRVKLLDKFPLPGPSSEGKDEDSDALTDFSPTSRSQVLNMLDNAEEMDKHCEDQDNNSVFKKPLLPAPCSQKRKFADLNASGGAEKSFRLASGKNVAVSQDLVNKNVALFQDILSSSGHTRENKYSFLSKKYGLVLEKPEPSENSDPLLPSTSKKIKLDQCKSPVRARKMGYGSVFRGFGTNSASNVTKLGLCKQLIKEQRTSVEKIRARTDFPKTNHYCQKDPEHKAETEFRGFHGDVAEEYKFAALYFRQFTENMYAEFSAFKEQIRFELNKNRDLNVGHRTLSQSVKSENIDLYLEHSSTTTNLTQTVLEKVSDAANTVIDKFPNKIKTEPSIPSQIALQRCFGHTDFSQNCPQTKSQFEGTERDELKENLAQDLPISERIPERKQCSLPNNAGNLLKDMELCQNVDFTAGFENSQIPQNSTSEVGIKFVGKPLNVGFASASGKAIKIPESALSKAKSVFKDIDFDNFGNSASIDPGLLPQQESSPNRAIRTCNKQNICGFTSASGNAIKITEQALKRATNVFKDIELKIVEDNSSQNSTCVAIDKSKSSVGDAENCHKMAMKNDVLGVLDSEVGTRLVNNEKFKTPGFTSASGNTIRINKDALDKALDVFKDIDINMKQSSTMYRSEFSIASKSGAKQTSNVNLATNNQVVVQKAVAGFTSASGNAIKIPESALGRARDIFKDLDIGPDLMGNGFAKARTNKDSAVELQNSKDDDRSGLPAGPSKSFGFSTASGKKVQVSRDALAKAQLLFKDACVENDVGIKEEPQEEEEEATFATSASDIQPGNSSFSRPPGPECGSIKVETKSENDSGDFIEIVSQGLMLDAQQLFKDAEFNHTQSNNNALVHPKSEIIESETIVNKPVIRNKRRLGISPLRPIQISSDKLEKARLLFDDHDSKSLSLNLSQNNNYNNNNTPTSNRIMPPQSCSTPLRDDVVPQSVTFLSSPITPIRINNNSSLLEEHTLCNNEESVRRLQGGIVLREPSRGGINRWQSDLNEEREKLENRLKIIVERQGALSEQKSMLEKCDRDRSRRRNGVLFEKKLNTHKFKLNCLKPNTRPGRILNITPRNAELVHFDCTGVSLQSTLDGAVLVPNRKDLIGLPEIEAALRVMPGVDSRLIPAGWIRNHYKWIVWKLSSYENFTSDLRGCLCVENVVQQLKYRYDREIDRAQRPALRRILEKDDVPQKRMVLCVSDVIKMSGDNVELELNDGWYGIKTTVDEPLAAQINNNKIRIGTKLIICGAELLNCDGCHPLEATDLVRLKINFNSTRRSKWYAKLGYQPYLEPFPVTLEGLHPCGGVAGCIRIFVARVYPVRYFERQDNITVWRNKKADDRRAQDFEYEQQKKMDKIRDVIRRDYEMALDSEEEKMNIKDVGLANIASVTCPKTLYALYKNADDLDSLQELLSPSQKDAIMEYQRNKSFKLEQEIRAKIRDGQLPQRNVAPVLKLLVIDAIRPSDRGFVFQIWRPTEGHLQTLKEGGVFSVFNVLPKKNGDLNATTKTSFKAEFGDVTAFNKYRRSLLPIALILESKTKPLFSEFDTVGLVVQFSINNFDQSLWLADFSGNLLHIKIFEGPKNCMILDGLRIGQTTSVSNLILSPSNCEFAQAVANQSTIVSSYPQPKYLQDGMEQLKENLPQAADTQKKPIFRTLFRNFDLILTVILTFVCKQTDKIMLLCGAKVSLNRELNFIRNENLDDFLEECSQKISISLSKIEVSRNSSSSKNFAGSTFIDSTEVLNETCDEDTLSYSRITSTDIAMSMLDIDKLT